MVITQDNAEQYNHLIPWLMQRNVGKRTMTQSPCLNMLGVAFQSQITVSYPTVFTGLYQI